MQSSQGGTDAYLLDTNITSAIWDRGHPYHDTTAARVKSELGQADRLVISVISLGETENGMALARFDSRREAQIRAAARSHRVILPVTHHIAETYGKIRAAVFERYASGKKQRKGRPESLPDLVPSQQLGVQENDLWLYSTAVTHNLIFVTADAKIARITDVTPASLNYSFRPLIWPWS